MFQLSNDNLKPFAEQSLNDFIALANDHLSAEFPEKWGRHDDEVRETWLRQAVERGKAVGFKSEDQLLRFCEVSAICGDHFGEGDGDRLALSLLLDAEIAQDWPESRQLVIASRSRN